MKLFKVFIGLVLFFISNVATGATVTDVYTGDQNVIQSVTPISDPVGLGRTGVQINESYRESTVIPYASQGVRALVNPSMQFFDKTLTITASDQHTDWDSMYVRLSVTNNTPYPWSDYHLIFYTQGFSQKLGLTLLSVNSSAYFGNDFFDMSSTYGYLGGTEIDFWSQTKALQPGQTINIWLRWDWGNPLDRYEVGETICIRQIATITPEPCECDLNHDGRCNMRDWLLFGKAWGRTDCPLPE